MNKYISWIITLSITAAIVAGIVWYSSRPGIYDTFAACIKNSGAIFYGAFWCPHCRDQKALFGKSAGKLPYVECSTPNGRDQLPICVETEIKTYPTWQFKDGERKTGVLGLNELSTITACPLVKDRN